jgi:hypothetical protein
MTTEVKTTFLDAVKTMIEATFATKNHPNEEEVRERAYLLWEGAGRPEGDGVDVWVQAEQPLLESP